MISKFQQKIIKLCTTKAFLPLIYSVLFEPVIKPMGAILCDMQYRHSCSIASAGSTHPLDIIFLCGLCMDFGKMWEGCYWPVPFKVTAVNNWHFGVGVKIIMQKLKLGLQLQFLEGHGLLTLTYFSGQTGQDPKWTRDNAKIIQSSQIRFQLHYPIGYVIP